MKSNTNVFYLMLFGLALMFTGWTPSKSKEALSAKPPAVKRYLYVGVPGTRGYLGYGGHGLLVFDMDNNHRFVKRIPTKGLRSDGKPSNVKGIAVSVPLNSIYITTLEAMQRIDLTTDKVIWEKPYVGGCDRMSISPDGKTMYLPSLEKGFWNVVDCENGEVIKKINVYRRAHNTIHGHTGERVYLDDIASPWLYIADTKSHTIVDSVGPFAHPIRPFTVNGKESTVFVTIDSLLGFEVGDLATKKKTASLTVEGWVQGPVKRHGNPSHGIGLTPDEKELWLCDGYNMRMHVFSATAPYQQKTTIPLRDMAGWITFSMDGKYAYPSTGDVIDVKTRKVLVCLEDEEHNAVQSEKMVEVQLAANKAVNAGNQFGIGRVTK
jgi:hypothetical protein